MRNNIGKKFGVFLLTACIALKGWNACPKQVQAITTQFTGTHFSEGFDSYNKDAWHKAKNYSNGSVFYCTWRDANIVFHDGIMEMSIKEDTGESEYEKFSGGEYRTNQFYQYGLYQVNMKPIKNDGVVSSFFVYTGPSDNKNWDEIDIEFVGKDTTKVQFNYFSDGVGNHEYLYDLGFDASQEFHTYGFYWANDYIAWYVDGKEVYRTPESESNIIPDESGRIMMNVWPGKGVDAWLNPYNGKTPLTAYYDWMSWEAPKGSSETGTSEEPDTSEELGTSEEPGTSEEQVTGNDGVNNTFIEIVEGLSVAPATQLITSDDTDNDFKGSTFAPLRLRVAKTTKTSQKLKWNKVKGAKGYIIFGSKCGTKMKLLKTIPKGSTTNWTRKLLKKNTYYKYLILAYKVVDGEKVTISTSKIVHVPTTSNKYCDIKSVKVNESKVTLQKGKTFTIKAKVAKAKSKLKIKNHRKIRFESTNEKVATVSNKGKITAKKKGNCYVYAYGQNGVFKKIKVIVK